MAPFADGLIGCNQRQPVAPCGRGDDLIRRILGELWPKPDALRRDPGGDREDLQQGMRLNLGEQVDERHGGIKPAAGGKRGDLR